MTDTSQPSDLIRTLSLLPLVLTPMWCSSSKNIEPVLVRKEPLYIVNLISFCVLVVTIFYCPFISRYARQARCAKPCDYVRLSGAHSFAKVNFDSPYVIFNLRVRSLTRVRALSVSAYYERYGLSGSTKRILGCA